MPRTVFVAGATSILGQNIVVLLNKHGDEVVTLTRTATGAAHLRTISSQVIQADALSHLDPCLFEGVDTVFSCLGNSVRPIWGGDRCAYTRFDVPANRNLIEASKAAGVKKFVYASVLGAQRLRALDYMAAHAQVEDLLDDSGLDYTAIRPTGFFSAFASMLDMAKGGPVPVLGDGSARTNPIHEEDLAQAFVDALESSEFRSNSGARNSDEKGHRRAGLCRCWERLD